MSSYRKIFQIFRNQKGIALLVALVAMTLLMAIAHEISYDVTVEYVVNSQSVQRVKAYWAARSGMELSLLRVKIFQKAQAKYKGTPFAGQLDLIWKIPFAWPPIIPNEMNSVDKELIQNLVKLSLLDGNYVATIQEESSRIDLNDLGSKSKTLREQTERRLLEVFEQKSKADEDWGRIHRDTNFQEIVNNMIDWVDADTDARSGGEESRVYGGSQELPPNRFFRSISELRLVAGVTEEFYQILSPVVTIYGGKSINPNLASEETLLAMDDSMSSAVVSRIFEQRAQQPFTDEKQFWQFVTSVDPNTAQAQGANIPLSFGPPVSFRLRSQGTSGKAFREIEAVVWDMQASAAVTAAAAKKEAPATPGATNSDGQGQAPQQPANPQSPPVPPPNPAQGTGPRQTQAQLPKGPPPIVEWIEK